MDIITLNIKWHAHPQILSCNHVEQPCRAPVVFRTQERVKDLETQKSQGELSRMMQASMSGGPGANVLNNPFGGFGEPDGSYVPRKEP